MQHISCGPQIVVCDAISREREGAAHTESRGKCVARSYVNVRLWLRFDRLYSRTSRAHRKLLHWFQGNTPSPSKPLQICRKVSLPSDALAAVIVMDNRPGTTKDKG